MLILFISILTSVFNGGCLEIFKLTEFFPPCVFFRTYSMKHNHSWKADRFSASHEISPHFMEPEGSLPHSQVPAICPYPAPARSSPYPHIPLPEDPSQPFDA